MVRPQEPNLARLLSEKFVPVRLTSLKGVDLSLFSFDYDQTFMALGMTPEGRTLFRWSSRDDDASALKDLAALLSRPWPAEGRASLAPPRTLADDALFARTKRAREPCYHCHYAHDAQIARERAAGTFLKSSLFRYPPPETLGITLEGAASGRVRSVAAGSAAQRAGLMAGDVLVRVGGTPVWTTMDVRHALEGAKGDSLALSLRRGEKALTLRLALAAGWRTYDISDRPSQGGVPPFIGVWEEPLPPERKQALGIAPGKLALRVSFLFQGEKWRPVQGDLRPGDIIVAADGKELDAMSARQFHTWIRLNKELGQTLTLTVIRGSERRQIPIVCQEVTPDE